MHRIIIFAAAAALAGCSQDRSPAANDQANAGTDVNLPAETGMANSNMVDSNMSAPAALASINQTSWEFTDPKTKKPMQESVDASGKYITVSGKEHIDHGTAVMKDGKACFTSAMTKEGEVCWTDPMIAVGQSGETTSDKGEKLPLKRTDYVPLTM